MKKQLQLLLMLFLMLYGQLSPSMDQTAAIKAILVTYIDRTLTRAPLATISGSYRRYKGYSSSTWSRNIASRLAEQYHLKIQTEWPISTLGVQCVVYEIPNDRSVDDVLESLTHNKLIESAQRMERFNVHTANLSGLESGNTYSDVNPQFNRLPLRLTNVHQMTTGKGVLIALIDTGVDIHHPDLEDRILSTHNLISRLSGSFNNDVHGTAVAGVIVARANNQTGSIGIAPDARLVAFKACWPTKQGGFQATCNSLSLAMAINQAIRMDVDIINLSLSGPPDPLVERLINQALAKEIIVVAADHLGDQSEQQSFPASLDHGIAALHLTATVDTRVSRHQKSIAVPSANILTTLPHGRYQRVSGCSIATAQVTAIVALLLEVNPNLTPSEIQNLLEEAQQDQRARGFDEIDVYALISRLRADFLTGG